MVCLVRQCNHDKNSYTEEFWKNRNTFMSEAGSGYVMYLKKKIIEEERLKKKR